MNWRRELFQANRCKSGYTDDILAAERAWVDGLLSSVSNIDGVESFADFEQFLDSAIQADAVPSTSAKFVEVEASREQFASLIVQYAVDGLTEAEAMFYIMSRLGCEAKAPVMRVLIDEFGCGNPQATHQTIYQNLLRELELPTEVDSYVDVALDELLDFVNIYHWLTRRAKSPDFYLGALAYTEAIIPLSYRPFEAACNRLGIRESKYFSEHIHIDEYHARDAVQAIRLHHRAKRVCFGDALRGVQIVRYVGAQAFNAAVSSSRKVISNV